MQARNAHASTEQLADLLAGVLPDAEAGSVAAHASDCAECGAVRERLAALPGVLAAAPAPALPPEVADRLDAAMATESDRRASAATEDTVVVPLRKVRRDRVRHWFAGAATAAAALIVISVAADVVDLGGSGDAASGDAASDQSVEAGDQDRGATEQEAAPEDSGAAQSDGYGVFGRLGLPEVAADDFAADVELLYDSGAFRAQRKLAAQDFPSGFSEADGVDALVRDNACGNRALRQARAGGTTGPFVLLDQKVVRLVADGPAASRLVQAYSCDDGAVVDSAVVDLTR